MTVYMVAELPTVPPDSSEREQHVVKALAIARAKLRITTISLQRYEEACARGDVPSLKDVAVDDELEAAIRHAEESTAADAPGYVVKVIPVRGPA